MIVYQSLYHGALRTSERYPEKRKLSRYFIISSSIKTIQLPDNLAVVKKLHLIHKIVPYLSRLLIS